MKYSDFFTNFQLDYIFKKVISNISQENYQTAGRNNHS